MRRAALAIAVATVTACTTFAGLSLDERFGPADPTRFDRSTAPPAGQSYAHDVQPILDRRCVVCHACYDAPCQLKATSWEGIARGASKEPVYDASRLLAAPTSRLYVDADKPSEWRTRGFFPVLNERAQTPEANRTTGLMHRLLMLKSQHPVPSGVDAPASALEPQPDTGSVCVADTGIDAFERASPQAGMPYGLPGLDRAELRTLTRWLEQGAPYEGAPPLPAPVSQRIALWERFFNGDSAKEQLFARYAYEHLFLANLYFDDQAERRFFKLVRSTTPPGQALKIVASRRPVDDPGVDRVYYRLAEERETIVAKTHMPYALNAARMARWRELFLDAPYTVERLPGYNADTAANPFLTFAALPVQARYRFMLDEAAFTIMGFIKGPVCRGQIALDVIEDRFWVTFLAPSNEYDQAMATLLQQDSNLMRLPSGSSNTGILIPWRYYARLENEYLVARTAFDAKMLKRPGARLDEQLIWDGDGRNDNAGLTIFRHYDSATVVKGMVGSTPKTAWVIGYPLLERIHYLLVADYDVYGNVGHQVNSRLFMDFLRMEGEFNFLSFLPRSQRIATRDYWYRGVDESIRAQVYGGPSTTLDVETSIAYRPGDAKEQLLALLQARLKPVLDTRLQLEGRVAPELAAPLRELQAIKGAALQWIPEATILLVEGAGGKLSTFSLLRDTAHGNVSHLIEGKELRPDENALTIVPGVVGSYPNAFYRARVAELPALAEAIRGLRSEDDYTAFARRWAVRRNNPLFWAVSDDVHARYFRDQALEAGVLDYGRLESR